MLTMRGWKLDVKCCEYRFEQALGKELERFLFTATFGNNIDNNVSHVQAFVNTEGKEK